LDEAIQDGVHAFAFRRETIAQLAGHRDRQTAVRNVLQ
jgi:hypothetical protein